MMTDKRKLKARPEVVEAVLELREKGKSNEEIKNLMPGVRPAELRAKGNSPTKKTTKAPAKKVRKTTVKREKKPQGSEPVFKLRGTLPEIQADLKKLESFFA